MEERTVTDRPPVGFWKDSAAGWISGAAGILVAHPLDTIKVRQQTLGESSSFKCLKRTYQYEGVRGFFKGMAFPAISSGVYNSIFFGVYGTSLTLLRSHSEGASSQSGYRDVFVAGCLGGVAQLTVACPVDLVKIQLQAQTGLGSESGVWKSHYESSARGPYQCVRDIVRTSGIRGLYRGLGVMTLRDIPSFGLYMVVHESVADWIKGKGLKSEAFISLIAGGLAGSISWASIMPLDVIKSKIQADNPVKPMYRGIIHCAISCYKLEGISVFGRGFLMMLIRAFPTNAAIFWTRHVSLDLMS